MRLFLFCSTIILAGVASGGPVHVWEKNEITLTARNSYRNPYTEVEVWVQLTGPGFRKRVYGFWDEGNMFRVRVLATAPGKWSWVSGSNTSDPGLNGKKGDFTARGWTESEKAENICRRGILRPTANGHAFEHPDGTPFFLTADTWWSTPTFRFVWTDDDREHPLGPTATFKDYVRFRKAQGFNSIAMIAAFPNWANDGKPAILDDNDKTPLRAAWPQPGTNSAKDMHNEGGRAFLFPGRVPGYENVFPDVDRINPAYFQQLDKKIDYLNSLGFIPFLEVARRDVSLAWKKYYGWPDSYARYIRYVWARYQANNMLLSPIHFDSPGRSVSAKDYNQAANLVIERYGPPPFGTLVSCNSSTSSLINFGDEARWLTFHQTGNAREHEFYWYLTEIFHAKPTRPGVAGEPYYAGYRYKRGADLPTSAQGGSERDNLYCRSAMYGNFLSGALGGHIYGADGIWQANIEPQAEVKMWDAFRWESAAQIKHFRAFVLSVAKRYQDLVPDSQLIVPSQDHRTRGFEGWAFCARTTERELFLAYLEKGCPQVAIRGALPERSYEAKWFNPRTGEWTNAGSGVLRANQVGRIQIPPAPSEEDWALRLTLR